MHEPPSVAARYDEMKGDACAASPFSVCRPLPKNNFLNQRLTQLVVEPLAPFLASQVQLLAPRRRSYLHKQRSPLQPHRRSNAIHLRPRQRGPRLDDARFVDVLAQPEPIDDRLDDISQRLWPL